MHAFGVLGDPVRRRILELLADGEQAAGAVTATIRAEFGISQPAVSQHLRGLRGRGSGRGPRAPGPGSLPPARPPPSPCPCSGGRGPPSCAPTPPAACTRSPQRA